MEFTNLVDRQISILRGFQDDIEKALPIGTVNRHGKIKTAEGWVYLKRNHPSHPSNQPTTPTSGSVQSITDIDPHGPNVVREITDLAKEKYGITQEKSGIEFNESKTRHTLVAINRLKERYGFDFDAPREDFYEKLWHRGTKSEFNLIADLRMSLYSGMHLNTSITKSRADMLNHIEGFISNLPKGHVVNNPYVTGLADKATNLNWCYAFYTPRDKAITLTPNARRLLHVGGDPQVDGQLRGLMYHEIGHAVSAKLRNTDRAAYVKFGEMMGWKVKDPNNTTAHHIFRRATGNDRAIPRTGPFKTLPLLTRYAATSAEECFAEYYAIYHKNTEKMNKWLDGGPKPTIMYGGRSLDSSVLGMNSKAFRWMRANVFSAERIAKAIQFEKYENDFVTRTS